MHMYEHITNGLNKMSVEDFWWEAHAEIEKLGLRKQFDKQIKKMETQEEHQYKDTKQIWEYALNKLKKLNQ